MWRWTQILSGHDSTLPGDYAHCILLSPFLLSDTFMTLKQLKRLWLFETSLDILFRMFRCLGNIYPILESASWCKYDARL